MLNFGSINASGYGVFILLFVSSKYNYYRFVNFF
jgi:hypothetical protein